MILETCCESFSQRAAAVFEWRARGDLSNLFQQICQPNCFDTSTSCPFPGLGSLGRPNRKPPCLSSAWSQLSFVPGVSSWSQGEVFEKRTCTQPLFADTKVTYQRKQLFPFASQGRAACKNYFSCCHLKGLSIDASRIKAAVLEREISWRNWKTKVGQIWPKISLSPTKG